MRANHLYCRHLVRCSKGRHTTERPIQPPPSTVSQPPSQSPVSSSEEIRPSSSHAAASCARCKGGYLCSDHGKLEYVHRELIGSLNLYAGMIGSQLNTLCDAFDVILLISDVAKPCHSTSSANAPFAFFSGSVSGAAPVVTMKTSATDEQQGSSARNRSEPSRPPKWDVMAERICRNGGCGQKYRELDNNDAACAHHPGNAVFHDRKRGVSGASGPSM